MAPSSDESFLARWSRLKRQPSERDVSAPAEPPANDESDSVDARACDEDVRQVDAAHAEAQPRDEAQGENAPAGRDFSDFNFDDLDFESDYQQFMKDDVPEDVRHKALRRLWVSNPVLANMDGLDDYCEDYTDAAVVPIGPLKTAYKIGRGFLSDEEVAEWEALGRADNATVALADEGQASGDAGNGADPAQDEARGDAADTDVAGAETAPAAAGDGTPAADVDASACPGAACAAVVKREEEAALSAYDAERAERGAGEARERDAEASDARRDKGQRKP